MKIFKPNLILKSIDDIDISYILDKGYKLIIFDMNNTIIDYYTTNISIKTKELIQKLKENNIDIYILTNSLKDKQAKEISNILKVDYMYKAFKPLPFAINKILKEKNIEKNKTIIVGDHIFTDILNGNLCKIDSILVEPLNKNEKIHSKLTRKVENVIIKLFKYN